MKYNEYIERWDMRFEHGIDSVQCENAMISLPLEENNCTHNPKTKSPLSIRLPRMQLLPFC